MIFRSLSHSLSEQIDSFSTSDLVTNLFILHSFQLPSITKPHEDIIYQRVWKRRRDLKPDNLFELLAIAKQENGERKEIIELILESRCNTLFQFERIPKFVLHDVIVQEEDENNRKISNWLAGEGIRLKTMDFDVMVKIAKVFPKDRVSETQLLFIENLCGKVSASCSFKN
jgi:hypothetical protein